VCVTRIAIRTTATPYLAGSKLLLLYTARHEGIKYISYWALLARVQIIDNSSYNTKPQNVSRILVVFVIVIVLYCGRVQLI